MNLNQEEEEDVKELQKRDDQEYLEYVKKTFSLADFMECPATREMIENEHRETFYNTVGKEAETFYEDERLVYRGKMSSLFKFDIDGCMGGAISSILYKHVVKQRDLQVIYENTDLTSYLINYLESKKEKKQKRKKLPKKATAKFNWATKKYE
jgi:hypothetical protein